MVAITDARDKLSKPTLTVMRTIDAPADIVFDAWSSPQHITHWWGPKGFSVPSWTMDFKPGGAFRGNMRSPEGKDHWHHGVYRAIAAPRQLVFTFAWENDDAVETTVSVTFTAQNGKTKVTLHQEAFDSARDAKDHESGWTECLDRLAAYAPTIRGRK